MLNRIKKQKNKIIFSVILLLIILTAYSALSFNVAPEIQDVEVLTSSPTNVYVNITNELNTSIYFITFRTTSADITFVDKLFNLTAGESKQAKITVDTSIAYNKEETIDVFYFEKQDIQLTPTQETVHITSTEFSPTNFSIIQGSSIRFINDDTIKHSVTSSLFDQVLDPGQEYTFTFNQGGTFNYNDKFTNYQGTIVVQETIVNEYVHNPLFDKQFKLKIRSVNIETSAELIFVDGTNYTVNADQSLESVFIIKNTGNVSIALAKFKANPPWISFSRDNLIIKPNEQSYVPFTIFPLLSHSNETGKTYTVEVTVGADNIYDKSYNLSITIPFKENINNTNVFRRLNQTITEDFAVILFNTICKANPEYSVCQPVLIEKIIYKSPTSTVNITQDEFERLQRKILENTANQERGYNNILELVNGIKQNSDQSTVNSAESLVLTQKLDLDTQETKGEIRNLFIFGVVVLVIILLILLMVGIFFLIKKINFSTREFKT